MHNYDLADKKMKEIYEYMNKRYKKQIPCQEAQKRFPGSGAVFALMIVDDIIEICELDEELVYRIVDNKLVS
jgi:hypothetical protein